jgi:ATP synthase F0 subunit c
MTASPLATMPLFHIGPLGISAPVVISWAIIAVLTLASAALTRRLSLTPTKTQAALELLVGTVDAEIRDTMQAEPAPYRAFIGTLFLLILACNWSSLIPGVDPSTAHLETDAALAGIVFCATIVFGIRARGPRGYLMSFAEPSWIMIPLNLVLTFRAAVRQCDERRVRHWHRIVARRAHRADPAHGARTADGRGAGLYLHRPRNGLHRGRAREARARGIERGNQTIMNDAMQLVSIIAAALAVSFGAIGPALAEGRAVAAAMDAIARQPESAGTHSRTLFVGLAMIETMAIYCLVVALLLLFANPFVK